MRPYPCLILLALASCSPFVSRAQVVTRGNREFRVLEFPSLRVRPGVDILVSADEPTHSAGRYRIESPREVKDGEAVEDPHLWVEEPTSPEAAFELCTLNLWGTLVETPEQFERILELYRSEGYELAPEWTDGYTECTLHEAQPTFARELRALADGFDVAFTAFVLPPGMGARGELCRYVYEVRDGVARRISRTPYLDGPVLNWQIALMGGELTEEEKRAEEEFMREQDELHARRDRLIHGIYAIAPDRIPVSR